MMSHLCICGQRLASLEPRCVSCNELFEQLPDGKWLGHVCHCGRANPMCTACSEALAIILWKTSTCVDACAVRPRSATCEGRRSRSVRKLRSSTRRLNVFQSPRPAASPVNSLSTECFAMAIEAKSRLRYVLRVLGEKTLAQEALCPSRCFSESARRGHESASCRRRRER